ncbi:MAG: phosphate ABC transporter substrate-binding protein [Spirochaetales bacterium]|nr:phosphate ABC transporter substrate-binding protein [Spirochaetales bacterium]
MKKLSIILMCCLFALSAFAGGNKEVKDAISVISREEGSGTRGAFVELVGVQDSKKVDQTTIEAAITNSTSVMMLSVSKDVNAIGYISLGSLNDAVKAIEVDGVKPSVSTIKEGSYKLSRPFNIVVKENLSPLAKDFIDFILSAQGQEIVAKSYIPLDTTTSYKGKIQEGKLVVAGSSSVTPIMEKLKEAYLKVQPQVELDVQLSDSSTGVKSAIEGICDIGMASRNLKDSEIEKGAKAIVIAMDGIAVIVNNENAITSLTKEQIKNIYLGSTKLWSEI